MAYYGGTGISRQELSGTAPDNYAAIIALRRELAELKQRCCCPEIGYTSLDVPVGDPGTGPKILLNLATGVQHYWNGTVWNVLFASGIYIPEIAIEQAINLVGIEIVGDVQWMRVGNVMTLSGKFLVDPETTLVMTSFKMSLPVSSAMSHSYEAGGVAVTSESPSEVAMIYAGPDEGVITFEWIPIDVEPRNWHFNVTLLIT